MIENQEQIEENLSTCPVCGSDDVVEMTVYDEQNPTECLMEQGIFDVNMSPEWNARICLSCKVGWATCRWVLGNNAYYEE